jgi:hypothetical protein
VPWCLGGYFHDRILKNIKIVQLKKYYFQNLANDFISIENNMKQYTCNIFPGFFLPAGIGLKSIVTKLFSSQQRAAGHFAQHLGFTRLIYYVIN